MSKPRLSFHTAVHKQESEARKVKKRLVEQRFMIMSELYSQLNLLVGKENNSINTLDVLNAVYGKEIGKGGFGSVYECYIRGTKYALKKFHQNSKNEKAVRESIDSEKSIINLCHPNIVRTYLTFFEETYCVLMEYVGQKTLQNLIDDENESIPIRRCIEFTKSIASGLSFTHSQNIAHLDLKPSNILLTPRGECKIADFGCCKVINDESIPSTPTKSNLTGTYSYRAPELLRGEPATTKSDIYSLGVCLWQMIVRDRPYGNEHHQIIIFKVVAYNLRPTIPTTIYATHVSFVDLMQKCWDQNKNIRPTAEQVLQYLSGNCF